ncbi:nucleotide-binding protein [Ferrimonas pelagia]|uniref:Nucleotide-binding protein n=1 Tax=Ferrimonas pelagia TaxID=1177826 RepID=A0ABP9FK51_9GAMM
MSQDKTNKPRVFIASSSEALQEVRALHANLEYDAELTNWTHLFDLSQTAIETLETLPQRFDFGIFLFTPDDVVKFRDTEVSKARDNVVFELGLFIGSLGRERCFIVQPRDSDLQLPSDLAGITPATYNPDRSDELESELFTVCGKLAKAMAKTQKTRPKRQLKVPNLTFEYIESEVSDLEHLVLGELLTSLTEDCPKSAWEITRALCGNGRQVQGFNPNPARSKQYNEPAVHLALLTLCNLNLVSKKWHEDMQGNEYLGFFLTEQGTDYILANKAKIESLLCEDDWAF